jgi:hypothetical protein
MATEGCPRRVWLPTVYLPIRRRNLLYHICPHPANDVWRKNVGQILRHWEVFNGRKLLVIATGPNLLAPEVVQEAIDKPDAEYILLCNEPRLREVVGLRHLLAEIQSTDSREASFFAHTKGNTTRGPQDGVSRWRNMMYAHLLGRVGECMEQLKTHAAVGTTKMTFRRPGGFRYPSGLRNGQWMFAGTFFWFRHDSIFTHPGWRNVPVDRYGAESWLGGLLPPGQGFSMFQPWPENRWPQNSPYAPQHYPQEFADDRSESRNRNVRPAPA